MKKVIAPLTCLPQEKISSPAGAIFGFYLNLANI